MFRQLIANLDRASGGRLRRTAGRAEPPAFAGPVVSIGDGRAEVAGVMEYNILQPARVVRLDDERQRAFLARQTAVPNADSSFQTEDVFRATLREVTFDPHSGAVWAADGALVLDSIKNAGRLKHVAMTPIAPGTLAGAYSSIASPISGNVFHWFIESLPRLYSLSAYREPITLLMPDRLPADRRAQLAACLPDNVSLRFIPAARRVRVERFVLPSFLTTQWDFAYPPYEHLAHVRDRLIGAAGLPSRAMPGERVYVLRDRARVRRVVNEAAVVELLQARGFRPHRLEELPFAEQVRFFRDADMVVAPHGAGLANLLFAPPIRVLEFASRAVTPVYFFLALALGQDYRYLYPQELTSEEPLPSPSDGLLYSAARDLDLTIDLDALRAMVDEWS